MTLDQFKELFSRLYPYAVRYRRARRLRTGSGKRARSLPRTIGLCDKGVLSVECIGSPRKLKWLDFMVECRDEKQAAVAVMATVTVTKSLHPQWQQDEALQTAVTARKDADLGKMRLAWQIIKVEGGELPLLFIKIKAI